VIQLILFENRCPSLIGVEQSLFRIMQRTNRADYATPQGEATAGCGRLPFGKDWLAPARTVCDR
jgi:hypothetical protein